MRSSYREKAVPKAEERGGEEEDKEEDGDDEEEEGDEEEAEEVGSEGCVTNSGARRFCAATFIPTLTLDSLAEGECREREEEEEEDDDDEEEEKGAVSSLLMS